MLGKRAAILLVGFILITGFQLAVFLVFPTSGPAFSGIEQSTSAAGDFSLSLSTYSTYIPQGGGSSVDVTVASISGFSLPVALSTGWDGPSPPNAQLSLPIQVTPPAGGSAKFLLTTTITSQTPVGTYTLILNARSGSYLQHQAKLAIFVAESTGLKVQPILGFSWPISMIPVSIQNQPSNARQAVLDAMTTWNTAQQWFIQTYGTGGPILQFYEAMGPSDSGVSITFNQTQTDPNNWGIATCVDSYNMNGAFTKVHCNISLDVALNSGQPLTQLQLQSLAASELGQALGLDHTIFSEYDLMNHKAPSHEITSPSTLNLYAVYLLGKAKSISTLPFSPVSLPSNIPYATMSTTVTTSTSLAQALTVTTDKPGYLCGSSVDATAVLTGGTVVAGQYVAFEAHDPSGAVLASGSSVTNPSGTVSFSFVIPSSCQAGSYSIIASSQGATARAAFSVSQNTSAQSTQTSLASSTPSSVSTSSSTSFSIPSWLPQIPGFPWESIIAGIILGLVALAMMRRRRR